MLCDVCLWLITEVYDKSQNAQKLITHKIAREFLSLSHCPCNTQWVIAEKAQILNTVCSHHVKKVGCECDCSNINSGEYKSFILTTHAWSWQALRRLTAEYIRCTVQVGLCRDQTRNALQYFRYPIWTKQIFLLAHFVISQNYQSIQYSGPRCQEGQKLHFCPPPKKKKKKNPKVWWSRTSICSMAFRK